MKNVINNMRNGIPKIALIFMILGWAFSSQAQKDSKNFLLLTPGLELETADAIDLMYNFKFDEAQTQFAIIKNRHPDHPLPYFLMAMNNWWKMMPYNDDNPVIEPWGKDMMAYLDTTISKADYYWEIDSIQVEAAFFLSAAYGLKARYFAERGDKLAAVMPSKHALKYFKRTHEENELSPEFLLGSALINYYGEWFREEYPGLKPILIMFPKGDKVLGLKQLKECSVNAFYSRTEALYFLMRIYYMEENKNSEAYPIAKYLAETYPDNAYFERMLARFSLYEGKWNDCEKLCKDILYKFDIKMPGYEENGARYASFFLGHIYRHGYQNKILAKEYYLRCILYAEKTNSTHLSYYLTSVAELARMSNEENDISSARAYYKTIHENASKKDKETAALWKEADDYLKKTKKQAKKK